VDVVSASPGKCQLRFLVKEEHLNYGGTMHGGVGAYLVDMATTMTLLDKEDAVLRRPGVSVDLNVR